MNSKIIDELNTLLKGEYMGIDSYEKFIQKVQNKHVKHELQNIQKDHKNHAIKIAERIQDLGGEPVNGVGFIGKIAEVASNIKNINKKSDIEILKQAYDGEDFGIRMATEVVKGDLDGNSAVLVKEMLNEDRNHLDTLNNLIREVGNVQ
ncbi:DUF2383 domain-containing protein [Caloramator sp. E03]|uniref:DUF2383 domain-containing protein n=1 Tax=Caloramator sp. E03 TaxID=2576307 RepID=UPI001110F0C3|nr:DUF2383 domain-containing protein [Caloramator sp. E03]QCX33548.1 DUF2383 domain-containing protein [Caloramator sp. E03]